MCRKIRCDTLGWKFLVTKPGLNHKVECCHLCLLIMNYHWNDRNEWMNAVVYQFSLSAADWQSRKTACLGCSHLHLPSDPRDTISFCFSSGNQTIIPILFVLKSNNNYFRILQCWKARSRRVTSPVVKLKVYLISPIRHFIANKTNSVHLSTCTIWVDP